MRIVFSEQKIVDLQLHAVIYCTLALVLSVYSAFLSSESDGQQRWPCLEKEWSKLCLLAGLAKALGDVRWLPLLMPGVYHFHKIQFSIPGKSEA